MKTYHLDKTSLNGLSGTCMETNVFLQVLTEDSVRLTTIVKLRARFGLSATVELLVTVADT